MPLHITGECWKEVRLNGFEVTLHNGAPATITHGYLHCYDDFEPVFKTVELQVIDHDTDREVSLSVPSLDPMLSDIWQYIEENAR